MTRRCWICLFTCNTWTRFLEIGAQVYGTKEKKKKVLEQLAVGDYLVCYVTGISRLVGALEVIGKPYYDETPIWSQEPFPCRVPVRLIHKLTPPNEIAILDLKDKLSFFRGISLPNTWTSHIRNTPKLLQDSDGQVILEAIENASGEGNGHSTRQLNFAEVWRPTNKVT